MEVKIGVQYAPREIVFESAQSADEVAAAVSAAFSSKDGLLTLVDDRGRRFVVVSAKIGYVEIGEPESRRVGFGAM